MLMKFQGKLIDLILILISTDPYEDTWYCP
jgi:hypothetical protein